MQNESIEKLSLLSCYTLFGIALVGYSVALTLLDTFLLDNDGPIGVSIIIPFFASMHVAERFLKQHKRLPSPSEQKRLVEGSLWIFIGFNVFITLLVFVLGGGQNLSDSGLGSSPVLWVGLIFVLGGILALNYFLLRWSYGGLARKRAIKLGLVGTKE